MDGTPNGMCVIVPWSPSERAKSIEIGDDIMIMVTKLLLLLSLSLYSIIMLHNW
jgi:hypothetical protein